MNSEKHHDDHGGGLPVWQILLMLLWVIGLPAVILLHKEGLHGFIIFGATLCGVAYFHHHNLQIAVAGLGATLGLAAWQGVDLKAHFAHEGLTLVGLFILITGCAILGHQVKDGRVGDKLPQYLPNDWRGGAVFLAVIFIGSQVLDNIAAAMIGAVLAKGLFKSTWECQINGVVHPVQDGIEALNKPDFHLPHHAPVGLMIHEHTEQDGHKKHVSFLHKGLTVGFLAAIVAAANAGGAHSVIGDTTTTMMWVDPLRKVPATEVLDGAIASVVALCVLAYFAAKSQDKAQRIQKDPSGTEVHWGSLWGVALALIGALACNFLFGLPGLGIWGGLFIGWLINKRQGTPWGQFKEALPGTFFLLSLVVTASLMPVSSLPEATSVTTLGIGGVSAVFDNIPLTKLALLQGGYVWPLLAFAVGFGGSMTWFGSTAGVSISKDFPEVKDLGQWLKQGWFVPVAYLAGFGALWAVNHLPAPLPLIIAIAMLIALHGVVFGIMRLEAKRTAAAAAKVQDPTPAPPAAPVVIGEVPVSTSVPPQPAAGGGNGVVPSAEGPATVIPPPGSDPVAPTPVSNT